ncbi:uncharacterized protein LOC133325120 [Musca vetustissima]|uniref:uncharacterized protein LOC133325120 n=1 Tax=Musca vetustissima TaxID=27455 RepID=UPI002AB74485|nr:uncharacterized protein LOC133325120 [Musca vetustissima]
MSSNILKITVFLSILFPSTLETPTICDSSICNHEGQCFKENGQQRCQCVGDKYFKGPHCNEIVDNCVEQPCQNNGECLNLVGQFICRNCAEGYGGLWCDIKRQNIFQNMVLYFNHYGYYAQEHVFLLMVEQRGLVDFSVELMGSNYVIDSFETNSINSDEQWIYSGDLESIIRKHGIRYYNDLPFKKGYYHLSHEVFWHLGILTLSLRSYDTETATDFFYYQDFDILIIPPKDFECVPQLKFRHGFDPLEPLMLDIARFNTFEGEVQERCYTDSNINYEWRIFNPIGNIMLYDFGNTDIPLLKVPPYRLWFGHQSEVMSSYSLVLRMIERSDGKVERITEARCFIFVLPKPLKANIVGGLRREIGQNQNILLNGSKSRDFALAPDTLQDLFYTWDCISLHQPENEFCKKNMGAGNTLHLAKGLLHVNNTYTFSLTIKSKVNPLSVDTAHQEVRIISDYQLSVDIKCRRNCLRDHFVAGQMIHVEGVCVECSSISQFYWKVNGINHNEKRHLLYTPKKEEKLLLIDLEVRDKGLKGQTAIELKVNTPPSGGECSVEPSIGIAFETVFHIECVDYEDKYMPLEYHYYSDKFPLKRISDPKIILKLPTSKILKIQICDQWSACNETELKVEISALPKPKNLYEFLMTNGTNLKGFIENSQRLTAIVLIKTVVEFVNDDNAVQLLAEQLHNFHPLTMIEVEQWLTICHDLIMNIRPLDYHKSLAITEYLRKLSKGLEFIIADKEIVYLNLETYQVATQQLINLVKEFATPWESLMEVQALFPETIVAHDPLAEHYSEFLDFDILVIEKITNWLESSRELQKCFELMSSQASNIYQPEEPAFIINENLFEMLIYAIDKAKTQIFSSKDQSIELYIGNETIRELQRQLNAKEIILQMGYMGYNRFWWYPQEQPISSNFVYISTFPQQSILRLDNPILMKFQLKMSSENREFNVKIKSPQHMPLFSVEMPPNSLLILKVNNYSVLVDIGLGEKPSGFQMQLKSLPYSLPTNKSQSAFNHHSQSIDAFIAFLANGEEVHEFPISFKFSLHIHQCIYWEWNLENPQWSSLGCKPTNVTNSQQLQCECQHFSDFAAKTYQPSVKEDLIEHWSLQHLPINWDIISFHMILLILCFTLIFLTFQRVKDYHPILITDASDKDYQNIELLIYTGSHWNATTTSNIQFRFVSEKGPYSLEVLQNPWKPQLLKNSITKILVSSQHIQMPFKLIISNRQTGRYPSWYCHKIIASNLTTQENLVFLVKKWVSSQPLELMSSAGCYTWSGRFYEHLSYYYINWFQFQPLWGPIQFTDLCCFERCCIWVSQTFVTVCIVSCYYGPTSMESYEKDRDLYKYLKFNVVELFILSFICFLASIFIKIIFKTSIFV